MPNEEKDKRHIEKQEEEQKTKLLVIRQKRILGKEKENISIGEREELAIKVHIKSREGAILFQGKKRLKRYQIRFLKKENISTTTR
ncbi:hypothetical protein NPIL_35461 [Nephila pilipes]|uniref:Uncharacterized protein n=1 Tax=Nephila pilipes TaxID=299642 RepID=A0A8X6UD69_NEPPI|nr:hypothetical protein NPIL_35461 [Nephila pilipes]